MDDWQKLYNAAKQVQKERIVSPFIEVGGVAAAILAKSGNIYVGVCIATACSLGMCAERSAIANMLTNGESEIDKIVVLGEKGKYCPPCGVCREFMMQLSENSGDIEILTDFDSRKTIQLKELMPDWWGKNQFLRQIMKNISLIIGGGRPNGNTFQLVYAFSKGVIESGNKIEIFNLNKNTINVHKETSYGL